MKNIMIIYIQRLILPGDKIKKTKPIHQRFWMIPGIGNSQWSVQLSGMLCKIQYSLDVTFVDWISKIFKLRLQKFFMVFMVYVSWLSYWQTLAWPNDWRMKLRIKNCKIKVLWKWLFYFTLFQSIFIMFGGLNLQIFTFAFSNKSQNIASG